MKGGRAHATDVFPGQLDVADLLALLPFGVLEQKVMRT